ncbi:MAG TPA: hypothetical protein VFG39_04760 [Balneolaceae bacterium]|nr:hypothetical protein [Balneolaceae bacterium]
MSENENLALQFNIADIATNEFAIVEEVFKADTEVGLSTFLDFGFNQENQVIGVEMKFQFQHEETPFLIISVTCAFQIESETWQSLTDEKEHTLTIPKGFASHLAVLTVGTIRGILHEKTRETPFKDFILPPINLTSLIDEDVVLDLDGSK